MRYFVKTFGCQMNEADSERIAAGLEARGHSLASKIEDADLIIINTCSVRQKAEDKVYGLAPKVLELKVKNEKLKVTLTGCVVGSVVGKRRRIKLTELQRRMPWVDEFVELEKLTKTTALLFERSEKCKVLERSERFLHSAEVFDEKCKSEEPALVAVMRGCDQFCSYCVVPYGRGPVRSRPMGEIIKEVECLVKQGVRWVMLLGQSINDYDGNATPKQTLSVATGQEDKVQNSFICLLEKVHQIGGLEKISLLSFNPWNFSDELVETLSLPKFERYIHLPVQSGDDGILKKMNRPYTVNEYKSLVKKIRAKILGVRIGTDAMVGFPGETEEQFQNTVQLFKELKFENAFIFIYSPRPGTAAAKLYKDDIPLAEKKRRHKVLTQVWKGSKD